MYRIVLTLRGAGEDHARLVEEVFPAHADELGREGCWKLVAGAAPGVLVAELWTDSATTAEGLAGSEAGRAFRAALEGLGGAVEETRGPVDEAVTLHISALRMG